MMPMGLLKNDQERVSDRSSDDLPPLSPHLLQQLSRLLPVLPLPVIDGVVSPPTGLDDLPEARVLFLQVVLPTESVRR